VAPFGGVAGFGARVSIRAGDWIGVDFTCSASEGQVGVVDGGNNDVWSPRLADGESPGRAPESADGITMLLNADIEADADHDGFGDETQDACPGVSGSSNGCVPVQPKDTVAPKVSGFSFGSTTLRAASKGGSVARKKAPVGTRVRYRVSEAGRARFTIAEPTAARGAASVSRRPRRTGRQSAAPVTCG